MIAPGIDHFSFVFGKSTCAPQASLPKNGGLKQKLKQKHLTHSTRKVILFKTQHVMNHDAIKKFLFPFTSFHIQEEKNAYQTES